MTPAAFVEHVQRFQVGGSSSSASREGEVKIEFLQGSLDGSQGSYDAQGPVSFKPAQPAKGDGA